MTSTPSVPSEWQLEDARPRQALDRLLRRPDAAKLVRATPAQPLFLFIKSLGLADATELLMLCSTEQLQTFLDMDAWEDDRVSADRVFPWLAALLDLGVQKVGAHVRRLDAELLTSFLAPRLQIYELTDEEPPDEPQGQFFATPDRFYMIDILPDDSGEDHAALLSRFIDALYRADLELARSIIQRARWDAGAETEDHAYRFRNGRMADLGYIEYYEALKIYMLLDPMAPPPPSEIAATQTQQAVVDTNSRALLFVPGLEDSDATFNRAAMYLPESERALLYQHLLLMGNRVMAADRVELGDATAARAALRRTAGYLSLGLEFRLLPQTARGKAAPAPQVQVNIARAAQVLRETSLLYLFRLGYSLTVQLRKLAGLLVDGQEGGLTTLVPGRDPAAMLPPRLGEPLRSLLIVRPLYSGYLDAVARPASPLSVVPAARPFASLRDLSRAAAFLSDLSTLGKFLTTGLGLRRDNLVEVLSKTTPGVDEAILSDLLGTMIANLLLNRPPVLVPIARRDLPSLQRTAWKDKTAITATLESRVRERALSEEEVALLWSDPSRRLVEETLDALSRSMASLVEDLPPDLADAVTRLDGLLLS